MNAATLIQTYGAGDNSVTDRMWYELALQICNHIADEPLIDEVEYINQQIKVVMKKDGDFTDVAERVFARMMSLRAPLTSRIVVEYVRSELEKL